MEELKKCIKESRNIKDNSINLYINSIKNLGGVKELSNYDDIILKISKYKNTTQKNKLTAIIVVLKCLNKDEKLIEKYSGKLKTMNEEYTDFLKEQKKTDVQKKNWIEYEDLIKLSNKIMSRIKLEKIKNKQIITNKEYDMLQQLIIIRTYLEFPIRNNFANMKSLTIKEYNDLTDKEKNDNNYIVSNNNKRSFKINSFKNKKSFGNVNFDISKSLNTIITIWFKYNKSGYFLTQTDRKTPMSSNGITKFLNKIFMNEYNKSVSTSMIRHILISHKNKDKQTIKEKEEEDKKTSNVFMHSNAVNEIYRKID